MSDDVGMWMATGMAFLAIVLGAVYCSRAEEKACDALGGHLVHVYKGRLCVSADGRILE